MSEQERHAVLTLLKLFTLYELKVGKEFWGGWVTKKFPRPDIQRMANIFAFMELNSHAPFYDKINKELNVATDEFYESYANDPTLKARMDFIDSFFKAGNHDLLVLAVFAMIEGVVLYSNFAFLKHFQSNGKNMMLNIVRGLNFSVRDENLHNEGGSWLFLTLLAEYGWDKVPEWLEELILAAALALYEHECRIIEMIFEKGAIKGITAKQMIRFIESRINICLKNLGMRKMFEVTYNPIAEWFYDGINKFQFNDFFTGTGREYKRGWDESKFVWRIGGYND